MEKYEVGQILPGGSEVIDVYQIERQGYTIRKKIKTLIDFNEHPAGSEAWIIQECGFTTTAYMKFDEDERQYRTPHSNHFEWI